MFDYLQKYNNLPKELRDKLSAPLFLSSVEKLEKKYGVYLASVLMRIMVKDVLPAGLIKYFIKEFKLSEENSKSLFNEFDRDVLSQFKDYLKDADQARIGAPLTFKKEEIKKPSVAGFAFSTEDEKEIREIITKAGALPQVSPPPADGEIELKLNSVIKKVNIHFGSELLAGRFRYILRTFLRGIRDKIQTKETLVKRIDAGGLGFDIATADKVLGIAGDKTIEIEKALEIKPPKKITLPEDNLSKEKNEVLKNIGARDVGYDLAALKEKNKPPVVLDTAHELEPPMPAVIKKEPEKKTVPLPKSETIEPPKKDIKEEKSLFKNIVSRAEEKKPAAVEKAPTTPPSGPKLRAETLVSGKIKMDDIKFEQKLVGPLDELKNMNTINFRRLNKDPILAFNKIREKIDLIGEDYSKRADAIKAWRSSPLNLLYLQIGEESIGNKKPINVIIEERKNAGKEFLSDKELEAIIELNRGLRF